MLRQVSIAWVGRFAFVLAAATSALVACSAVGQDAGEGARTAGAAMAGVRSDAENDDDSAASSVGSARESKPSADQAEPRARIPTRGMAIQINSGYDVLETYVPQLRQIADLGANTVLISAAGYMEHAKSQAIFLDGRRAPSKADLIALIREARKMRLRVMLMPIVLLSHPRGSEWRGVIDPPDWHDWWRQYRDFVRHFADVAAESDAEMLMVGSELVSTEKQTAEWIKVIELCRERFRKGKLGYSANWDHYDPVKFWDRLDFIGMTSYYTLADKKGATIDEIAARWMPIQRDILSWREKIGKPLFLTEVGWCSQEGAATAPWNYYQNQVASAAGLEEQRRLYEGFLKTWDGAPGLDGVIWWEWTNDAGGATDYGYTPRNKPAEHVLRRWFAEGGRSGAAVESP